MYTALFWVTNWFSLSVPIHSYFSTGDIVSNVTTLLKNANVEK
jgi:hypothetical protein